MMIPDCPNVSLVMFYGHKPSNLIELILDLQTYLHTSKLVGGKFTSYKLEQVHGTAIGCEGLKTEARIISKWFYENRNETKYIDLASLIKYFDNCPSLPINIRFGGYDRDCDYGFLSRGLHPFDRSFQLQLSPNKTIIPVLIGWSFKNNHISREIDDLRRKLQQFNLLHKYYQTSASVDNDCYLALGIIKGELTPEAIKIIENDIRDILKNKFAINISLKKDDLAFARYHDLFLTPKTTQILPVTEANLDKVNQLY